MRLFILARGPVTRLVRGKGLGAHRDGVKNLKDPRETPIYGERFL